MHSLCLAPFCLTLLSDFGLCMSFDRDSTPAARSRSLVELSRRGGLVVVTFLTRKHDELLKARAAKDDRDRHHESTVDLLTALRRAQGQPDPLVVVATVRGEIESIFPNLPIVDAALINRDPQEKPVTFKEGGDYRSGRQDRWRFDVRDTRGKAMPVRTHRGIIHGGGIYRMGVLKHEESWETSLRMRSFIELPPGDYTVVVEYHDEETIASLADTSGLVVCRSKPFKLHVQPRVIDVTKADLANARKAIASFPDKGPVRILEGPFDERAHEFVRPESGAGRLLVMGWRAVPALLDALDEETATNQRRAWVFAVLYSITGWNDPRHDSGVLAAYESRDGSWIVAGGRGGKEQSLGIGFGGSASMSGGKFDGAAQKAFAKHWENGPRLYCGTRKTLTGQRGPKHTELPSARDGAD